MKSKVAFVTPVASDGHLFISDVKRDPSASLDSRRREAGQWLL